MNLKAILFLWAIFCLFSGLLAQNKPVDSLQKTTPLRVYNTIRLSTAKPVIDGVLDDDCWQTGEWSGDFTQWIPNEGAAPSQDTRLKILYDDKNLYVALRGYDTEPSRISRKAGRRDELTGDVMGITFDSYHDHRTGFEFSVTAAGQKVDLILTNPMNADFNWNAVWYVKTGLEDSAWVAEYEIPLSQLRYSQEEEQVWGMHVWRWIDRLSEESDWERQSLTGPGALYLFGELRGIRGLPKSRRIEIMPYAVGKLKTFTKEPLNPFNSDGQSLLGNVGLDAKIGLSSNFTADLTVNPDFGQVEADPSEMNLTAFETFYEEKRPFFLEGKNIFSFDLGEDNLFYSRRIGQAPDYRTPYSESPVYRDFPDNTSILSAVKISGKTSKGLAVGVLHSMTASEKGRYFTNGQTTRLRVEPLTSYMLARVQQDYKEGNTVLGGILTSANRFIKDDHLDYKNRNALTTGIDFLHQWHDKEFFLDAKLIGSSISGAPHAISELQKSSARYYQRPDIDHVGYYPSLTRLEGMGAHVKIGKGSKGLLRYSTQFNWKSPGLDLNDMGFMQLADMAENETEISYFVNKPVAIFRTYTLALDQSNQWDSWMNYQHSKIKLRGSLDFMNRWQVAAKGSYRTESVDTRLLRGGEAVLLPAAFEGSFHLNSDFSKKVIFSTDADFIGTDYNNYKSSFFQASLSVIPYNVLKLSLSIHYSEERDNLHYFMNYITYRLQYQDNHYEPVIDQKYSILSRTRQKSLGSTFRVDFNITPELSLQYYASPYASAVKYTDFKYITTPRADYYYDRFAKLTTTVNGSDYDIQMPGKENSLKISNPNFIFTQFRSNLVFRWEYRPGSQLFLVWGNERTNYESQPAPRVNDMVSQLKKAAFNNIFLVKLNYWFSM